MKAPSQFRRAIEAEAKRLMELSGETRSDLLSHKNEQHIGQARRAWGKMRPTI